MEMHETEDQQNEGPGIAIYSRWAIAGFSIFFSPLIGGILLMLNLRSVGLKKEGTGILLLTIAYQIIAGVVLGSFVKVPHIQTISDLAANRQFLIYSKISDIIGAGILAEYFFRRYFPGDKYERKGVLRPLFTVILILISLSILSGL